MHSLPAPHRPTPPEPASARVRSRPVTGLPAIALLDADDALADAVPEPERMQARRVLVAPVARLQPGGIQLRHLSLPGSTFAAMVVDGELSYEVAFAGRALTDVLTRGDVLTPWEPEIDDLQVDRHLFAVGRVRLAILDARFLLAAARWPALMLVIQRRLGEQEHRRAVQGAICQLPRVEDRLIAMLRLIGARTGRVGSEGLVVPLRATHETLGRLVGARRPTISLALKELERTGRLRRRGGGAWVLLTPPV